jgi:hypothetical protein
MPDLAQRKRRGPPARLRIDLPSGDYLEPRVTFAKEVIGVCDRTAARLKLPTTYIGAVAYVPHNEALSVVAAGIRRAPPSLKRRRRR